jgi:ABC-type Mn2+/Zn2+ transport systems, permease components
MIWHLFFQPFIEYGFMRRALVVCLALSVSTTALGVFLLLRRMSLMGDALSHAILPGVAVGYLLSGMSLLAMSLGGFIAGIVVALVAGLVSRRTPLKEDASFAGFYLGSLALGVTLVSLRGSNVDLLHLLFGSILAVDNDAAMFVAGVCIFTLITLAVFYRGLVTEAFDTAWLQVNARWLPGLLHGLFLALLVLNLVAGFQVLGTLMAVGLMMLPAVAARCWVRTLPGLLLMAGISGIFCAWLGLSLSWAVSLPAGPSIVLTASALFLFRFYLARAAGWLAVCAHFFNARGKNETYRVSRSARARNDVAHCDGENAQCGDQLFDPGRYHPGSRRQKCKRDNAGGAGW